MHILITGASSGIGMQTMLLLANAPHKLSVCGRTEGKLDEAISHLPIAFNQPVHLFARVFDINDTAAMSTFCDDAVSKHGDVDVVINCAGANTSRGPGHELQIDDLKSMLELNFYAPIKLMQAIIPAMIARKSGTIVNVLSTTCLFANKHIAGYSASKAALDSYTKVMRKELKEKGIRMLSIYPGGVDTDFRNADRPEYLAPRDVAESIVNMIQQSPNAHVHELVIRPACEENFA